MDNEVWKPIDGYGGKYLVSNLGRVMNHKRKTIKTANKTWNEYYRVELWSNNRGKKHLVHRLVASAFIPNPYQKLEVNHKDHNRLNNSVSNLEWATNSENQKHRYEAGRCKSHGGDNTRISVRCVETGEVFYSMKEAEKRVPKADRKSIKLILDGKRQTSGGFHWEAVHGH